MDDVLIELSTEYREKRGIARKAGEELRDVYRDMVAAKERTLLEIASTTAVALAPYVSEKPDFTELLPQVEEAFHYAFPNTEIEALAAMSARDLQDVVGTWKASLFEVQVRDRLNEGGWVGDVHLEEGQIARVVQDADTGEWGLQVYNANETPAVDLQERLDHTVSAITEALEAYPDMEIVPPGDQDRASAIAEHLHDLGTSEDKIDKSVFAPMKPFMDSAAGNVASEFAEYALPALPFVILSLSEGTQVMIGRKDITHGLVDFTKGSARAGITMGVAYLVFFLDGGFLSIPATFLARLSIAGFDRYHTFRDLEGKLDTQVERVRSLRGVYCAREAEPAPAVKEPADA